MTNNDSEQPPEPEESPDHDLNLNKPPERPKEAKKHTDQERLREANNKIVESMTSGLTKLSNDIPDDVKELEESACPEHVAKALATQDAGDLIKLFGDLKRTGAVPEDWPPLTLGYDNRFNRLVGYDYASACALMALRASPMKDGVERMPKTYQEIQDGFWFLSGGSVLVWSHIKEAFALVGGDTEKQGKALYKALQDPLAHPYIHPTDQREMQLSSLAVWLGVSTAPLSSWKNRPAMACSVASAAVLGLRNYLLTESPAFEVAYCVLTLSPREGEAQLLYYKVIGAPKELEDREELVQLVMALAQGGRELDYTDQYAVVTSADEAFRPWADSDLWRQIRADEYILTTTATNRAAQWKGMNRLIAELAKGADGP